MVRDIFFTQNRYLVPPEHKEDFDKVIKAHYKKQFEKNPGALYNITLAMNPLELQENNVINCSFLFK